jgi:hypothetical protein
VNIGWFIEQERHEAYERAMARYRASQAREQRLGAPGRGARRLSREEAVALIAKKSPRGALKLLAGYLTGIPARRGVQ